MKAMRKVKRGKGFRGAVSYALENPRGDSPGRVIGGNMAGWTARQLAAEFAQSRKLRPEIEKPVWHQALRLPEGEKLPMAEWREIADQYMERLGFTQEHQRIYILHDDAKGQHVHIIASRIALDGQLYLGQNENLISTKIVRQLEKEHGLQIQQETEQMRRTPTQGEVEVALATGQEPTRQRLQRIVDQAKRDRPTAVEFAERLELAGVEVRANLASTGRMNGFSFSLDGQAFKASQLGKGYTWANLSKEVSYEQDRDSQGLERFRPAAASSRERAVTQEADLQLAGDPSGADTGESGRAGRAGRQDGHEHERLGQGDGRSTDRHQGEGREHKEVIPGPGKGPDGLDQENRGGDQGGHRGGPGEPESGRGESAQVVAQPGPGDAGRRDQRDDRSDWSRGFRQAAAARRSAGQRQAHGGDMGQGHAKGAGAHKENLRAAKEVSPLPYLASQGFQVVKEGRHYSVRQGGDEAYRLTHNEQRAAWLWCDHRGNLGGDNLDLVREIEGHKVGLAEALHRLGTGDQGIAQEKQARPRPQQERPRIPADTERDRQQGREYLKGRGLDDEAIQAGSIGPGGPDATDTPKIHRGRGQTDSAKERDHYFARLEDGTWVEKRHPDRAVFRLESEQVTVFSRRDVAIRAALLTASENFGSPLYLQGEDEFRQKAWLAGSKMGLETKGYDPTAEDLAELTAWREKHGGVPVPDSIGTAQPGQQNEVQSSYTLPAEKELTHEHDPKHVGGNPIPNGGAAGRNQRAATSALEAGGDNAGTATGAPGTAAAPAADGGAWGRNIAVAAGSADPGGPGDRVADRAAPAATREGDGSRDGNTQSHGGSGGPGGAVAGRDRGVQGGGSTNAGRREGLAAGGREIPAAVGDTNVGSRGQRTGSDTSGPVADSDGTPVLRHVPPVSIAELSDFGRSFRACLAAEQAGSDDAPGGGDVSRDVGESIGEGAAADRGDHNPTAPPAPGAAVAASDHPPAPEAEPPEVEKNRPQQQKRKSSSHGM